ncbi:MAG: phasin family protein [Lysobacterales bacterium]
MAKKKASKKSSRRSAKVESARDNVKESASQIWLAGLGALSKAGEEGAKFFENLVRDGLSMEKKARKDTESRVNEVREAVEGTVEQVQARANASWDKLERVFEDRVAKALSGLGVPSSEDVNALSQRIADLQVSVDQLTGKKPARRKLSSKKKTRTAKASSRKTASKAKPTAASKKTTKKVVRKKATSKKATSKKATSKKATSKKTRTRKS